MDKMKENSIEEAIERLEYIDRVYSYNNYYSRWDLKCIDILLSEYKRILKENEELKENKTGLEEEIQEQAKNLIRYEEYITYIKRKIKNKKQNAITKCNELQTENEELKKFLRMGSEVANNSILIPKIKCKIEELDIAILECEYSDDDDEEYKKAVEKDKLCLLNQKRALQELLEGGQS